MLHHVFPGGGRQGGFAPNAVLEIDPDFLDQIIGLVKADGYELVSLDEAVRRVREGRSGRPFAAFTLDDGYRDNLVHAKPVFDRHQCPYTIYVATSIIDGTCELWWRALELAIARSSRVTAVVEGRSYDLEAGSPEQKWAAWHALYWPVRQLDQKAQRDWIRSFSRQNGIDLGQMCREAAMTWNDLRGLAADPLCSIGAHTENHYALAALSPCDAAAEMIGSADRIERELGTRPVHFAYPYGDANSAGPRDFRIAAEAGFKSAVTTRKGLIYRSHADHLHALPRLSLTGELQEPRYVQSLLTGVPFLIYNRLQRLNVN